MGYTICEREGGGIEGWIERDGIGRFGKLFASVMVVYALRCMALHSIALEEKKVNCQVGQPSQPASQPANQPYLSDQIRLIKKQKSNDNSIPLTPPQQQKRKKKKKKE